MFVSRPKSSPMFCLLMLPIYSELANIPGVMISASMKKPHMHWLLWCWSLPGILAGRILPSWSIPLRERNNIGIDGSSGQIPYDWWLTFSADTHSLIAALLVCRVNMSVCQRWHIHRSWSYSQCQAEKLVLHTAGVWYLVCFFFNKPARTCTSPNGAQIVSVPIRVRFT